MTGNFNIRNSLWDLNFPFHSVHSDILFDIADSFSLAISKPTENFPTRFLDNDQNSNLVLDLVFLCSSFLEFNYHYIYPEWRLLSNHAPITVDISISDKNILTKQWSLIKGSNEENWFIEDLIQVIKNLNTTSIQDAESLEEVVWYLVTRIEDIWFKHLKIVNITRHFKAWWNKDCHHTLNKYQQTCSLENWKDFKSTVKKSKHTFFDDKIDEITNKKCGPWELIIGSRNANSLQ